MSWYWSPSVQARTETFSVEHCLSVGFRFGSLFTDGFFDSGKGFVTYNMFDPAGIGGSGFFIDANGHQYLGEHSVPLVDLFSYGLSGLCNCQL